MNIRGLVARHRDLVVDVAVAAGLASTALLLTWSAIEEAPSSPVRIVLGVAALVYLPIIWWRRRPLIVLVVVSTGALIHGHYGVPEHVIVLAAVFIALVGAGAYGHPHWRTPVRIVAVAALIGQVLLHVFFPDMYQLRPGESLARTEQRSLAWFLGFASYNLLFFLAAWVLGDLVRKKDTRERELAARTAELEVERRENARRAVLDERLRIARELHDALGHHVSTMGVQAAGAERIIDQDPRRARRALTAIQDSSRRAVHELQHALRLLRDEGEETGSPVRLALVEHLADEIRSAGVEVTVQRDDPLPRLPESVDLAATRVIQEALTNVLRHAGPGSSAWVQVRTEDGALHITVEDDGGGRPDPEISAAGSGNGLTGLRERVELHEGELEAEHRAHGGFRVAARLPLAETGHEPAGLTR